MSAPEAPGSAATDGPGLLRRVAALRSLHLLDTPPEERFDQVVRLAQQIFDVPVVGVNLVDADRQFTKAGIGLAHGDRPIAASLCAHTVLGDEVLEIPDALADERWAEHPAAHGDDAVRFYAGAPLHAPTGERVGSLCLADDRPRELTDQQRGMLQDLAHWIEREMATTADLAQGRELQRRLLPRRIPDLPGWEVAGRCVQAGAVGGDFFDWQVLDGAVQVLLADVMGKGLSAALVGAGVRAVVRGASPHCSLSRAVGRVATDLADDLAEAGSFVTLFACRFTPATGALEYVDAGHGLAFVVDATGSGRRLRSDGLPVGALPDDSWEAVPERLAPGEVLVVVSDGLLDLHGTPEALLAAAAGAASEGADPEDLVERLAGAGDAAVADDLTVLVVRREPG